MKRKILLLVLVLFLISILAGCEPHFLDGDDDYIQVEDLVYNYWIAMINRQYDLAKYSCVPDGIWYNKTDEWEEYINANSEGEASTLIYFHHFYKETEVIGDNAIVYVEISVDKIAFPGCSGIFGDYFEYETEVIRGNITLGAWRLK